MKRYYFKHILKYKKLGNNTDIDRKKDKTMK